MKNYKFVRTKLSWRALTLILCWFAFVVFMDILVFRNEPVALVIAFILDVGCLFMWFYHSEEKVSK